VAHPWAAQSESAAKTAGKGSKASAPHKKFTPHAAIGKAKNAGGISAKGRALTIEGLKGSTLPSVAGLSPAIQGMLGMPGLSYAGKEQIASLAMEQAQATEGKADDVAVRAFERELFGGRKAGLEKRIAAINAKLSKRGLTPKQQTTLLGKREAAMGELAGVTGQLGGLEAEEKSEAEEKQREATEALTAAINEHKAVEEELKAELKRQTDFANEATATSSAVAWKALADILSGNLGAKTYHSAQTAGNGSLGSY
jgi:hypothetical protein